MPKVSVVVPNFNHAKFLQQRLDSIFNQTYQDFEVILLDDCSTDNSRDILEQYRDHPKVSTMLFNERNSGSTFKQWEKGIALSSGKYIWIAESDDYCETTFLSELVPHLDAHGHVGIAYCQSISADENNVLFYNWLAHTDMFTPNIWQNSFWVDGTIAINNFFVFRNVIPNASGAIFRRSTYNAISEIDTTMTLNGDWLLWIKMLETSNLLFLAKSLNFFRQHHDKATGRNTKNFNNLKELFKLLRYVEVKNGMSSEIKKKMTDIAIKIWMDQISKSKPLLSFRSFPKVHKNAIRFNKYVYWNMIRVIFEFIKNKLTGRKKNTFLILLDDQNFTFQKPDTPHSNN